jgi:oligoendopeptidase F
METDKASAWKSYIALLKKAGTEKLSDLVSDAGLKSPFDPDCLGMIVESVAKILSELRD